MNDNDKNGSEQQQVVDHLWWGNNLEVVVYDSQIGRSLRVQFDRALDGRLKKSGGGGYRETEKDRFTLAKETAVQWVVDEFGYVVLGKEEWSPTRDLRGMRFRDRQEISKLSVDQRRELARRLREDEITFDSLKSDCDSPSRTTESDQE